jgi:Flp pilus assembly protein TadG
MNDLCTSGIKAMGLPSLKNFLRNKRVSRFLSNDDGVTVIEFAFLGPLFLTLLLVTFESSLMLFTEHVIQTSVQEAARLVRTGQAQSYMKPGMPTPGMTPAQFKSAICSIAKFAFKCEANLTVYMNTATTFAALEASTPSYLTITAGAFGKTGTVLNPPPFKCGQPSEAVALIATYDWRIATPWVMSGFANVAGDDRTRRLVGFSMFRNEPYPAGGTSCKLTNPPPP